MSTSLVLVLAFNHEILNNLPPDQVRMKMSVVDDWKACLNKTAKKMLNRVGAKTHPCFTPPEFKGVRGKAIMLDDALHTHMEGQNEIDEFGWATNQGWDLEKSIPADKVKCFGEIQV